MKYTTLFALEKHLKEASLGHFSSVYAVIGKDDFSRSQAIEVILQALLNEESREFSLRTLEGDQLSAVQLLQELSTRSLFTERTVIVIQQADKLKKSVIEALQPYLSQDNAAYLILSASSILATTSFYKALEKFGVILSFAAEKPWEKEKSLAEWMRNKITDEGKTISPALCMAFVKQIGSDNSLLEKEVEKLLCYVGDRTDVTSADLTAIGGCVSNESGWQLGEAILRLESGTALRIAKELLSGEFHLLALLAIIRKQLETDYQVCSILSSQGTRDEVREAFPYMQGSILDRHIQLAQGYGMSRFKKGLQLIHETEMMAKNSQGDPELLATRLIVRLTEK